MEPKLDPADLFERKIQSRESRLSLRSGTDDSIHSSSSKHETTDEDNTDRPSPVLPIPPPPIVANYQRAAPAMAATTAMTTSERIKEGHLHHLIDDESGFSSMNSFQEIGLPIINSTMRSPGSSAASTASSESTEMENTTTMERTLVTAQQAKEKVGVPLQISHRRWGSAPVTPARLQLSSEASAQVLWV